MSSLGINKVILVGHLGKDPDIRIMQNGKEMASFSIATSETWVDKNTGVRTEKTEWHSVVVFSEGLVKIVKSAARKGSKMYVEGSLRTRKWVDQNNNDRYTTEIVLQSFNSTLCLLDPRGSGALGPEHQSTMGEEDDISSQNNGSQSSTQDSMVDDVDFMSDDDMDDIPF